MIAKERQNLIIDMLKSQKLVNAQELAAHFGVSVVTIRRDLDQLVEGGIAKRIHGGAVLEENAPLTAPAQPAVLEKTVYAGRIQMYQAEKIAIAKQAAARIHDGQTIYLDCGTTTAELAKHLHDKHITVVTCSLAVMNELYGSNSVTLFAIGGKLRRNEAAFSGAIAMSVLNNFYLDCAFVGAAGVAFDVGITEYYYETVDLHKLVMERSKEVVLLTDSSKFGTRAFAVVDRLEALDAIITDTGISDEYADGIRKMNIDLILADPATVSPEDLSSASR